MRSLSLSLVLGLSLALGASTVTAAEKRPNILYIMSDDHAAHAISAYGSKINKTPNIDRIAAGGMRFTNCFVTNSICTPSRATIITGKYSHLNGVPVFNRFDGRQPTVAKYLRAAGYYTGMVGKWHLGSSPTGFDYWNILPGQGVYHNPVFYEMGKRKQYKGYCTDRIADISIQFLDSRPRDRPFFLMCHHKAPHRPWQPDEKHRKQWEKIKVPEPETFNDDYATRSDAAREATMRIDRDLQPTDYKKKPPEGLTPAALKKWKYQRYMQDYLACIASVDDNVGRLLEYLEKNGLAENTIVIYTSDQGFFLGDHNWYDKRFMYEESLRMPFLVRWPAKIKRGVVNDAMILNIDFAPTFLAAAGKPTPADMQGRSILPLLEGKNPADWRTAMYYRYYHYPQHHRVQPHYGVRTDRYKLIYFNKIKQWELFDLKKDPHELKNVYADPAYADTVKKLKAELFRLKKEAKDEDQFENSVPRTSADTPPTPDDGPAGREKGRKSLLNVPYGTHPRQVLDFYPAESKKPTPVVFYIHGGGWRGGDKQKNFNPDPFLARGISVVAINYRYVQHGVEQKLQPPVKAPLEDAARALQFVRSRAAEWHLDKKRIGATGGSAGACSSLWLAFHADMARPDSKDPIARESTRLYCAAVNGAQTSLDPRELRAWMPNYHYGAHAFGLKNFQSLIDDRAKVLKWIKEYSPIEHVSKDDPPIGLFYGGDKDAKVGDSPKDPTHSPILGIMLQERLKAAGVDGILVYPGHPHKKYKNSADYLIDHLLNQQKK